MIVRFIEKIKFRKKYGGNPTVCQFIDEWIKAPEKHFFGYYGKSLE
ncbi:hypothetical protein RS130_07750 [Paraglaciecola aquimarina]|uniref:Uncharacterized protein n=1 Tax=Paraglaciecola aquimarina TaxID=1235557 RepID=A0ABU3SUY9_9ALTE|nr:hypothetical protein [Paraglaciecola aquimarina]MDU0353834.1 hypothetical protein [Paraglaciecola aquimarina]